MKRKELLMWNTLANKKPKSFEQVLDEHKAKVLKNRTDIKKSSIKLYKNDYPIEWNQRVMRYNGIKIRWANDLPEENNAAE